MGLFSRKKKESKPASHPDPRFYEKIKQSDLLEYVQMQIDHGFPSDKFYGEKIPSEDTFTYFVVQLTSVNSGIVSKENFKQSGFSESEIDAIVGKFDKISGLSHPTRCIKDLVWHQMFQQETARLSRQNGSEELCKKIENVCESRRKLNPWLDWDKAISEFWIDESLKDYKSYIITK
jgi:hypothetical protein